MTGIVDLTQELVPACTQLLIRAYATPPWSEAYHAAETASYLEKFLHHPGRIALVWVEEDAPSGLALGIQIPGVDCDYFHLEEFCVWPQRCGTGNRFLCALKEYIHSLGMDSILLGTVRDYPAFFFYQKHHFQPLTDSVSLYCSLIEEGNEL